MVQRKIPSGSSWSTVHRGLLLDAAAQIRNLAWTDPVAAADAAWAASDTLQVAAAMLGSRILPM